MADGQPFTSNAMLLKRWTDVLQHWERKHNQYEAEAAQITEADRQQELSQSLETCQSVIATCQALLQALQGMPSDALSAPAGRMLASPSPKTHPQSAVRTNGKTGILPLAASAPSPLTAPPRTASPAPWGKRLWVGIVSLALLAAVYWIGMRPRNDVCKTSPTGAFDPNALTRWVEDAIRANSRYAHFLRTVAIAQYGCIVVLKGRVPSSEVRDDFIQIAAAVKIPNQAPEAKLQQWLGLSRGQTLQPVERVVSQIQIGPLQPWEQ